MARNPTQVESGPRWGSRSQRYQGILGGGREVRTMRGATSHFHAAHQIAAQVKNRLCLWDSSILKF